jgi:1-acyl-sn-glycerol-3-phosphate acyltransferase
MAALQDSPPDAEVAALLRHVRFGRVWSAAVSALAGASADVCFRRIRVVGAPLPQGRPLLVIANHPAAWTDVAVLFFGLQRRLHFLAQRQLFEPASRAWFLRLYGALPVMVREHSAESTRWNAAIFRACLQLLERGEPVAMFPEGASVSDRSVLPFRPGFARLLLDHARMSREPLVVIPVGIHYQDRAAFRSDVEITVGEALPYTLPPADGSGDHAFVEALTLQAHERMTTLVVHLPDPEQEALLCELESTVLADWRTSADALDVEIARELAATVRTLAATRPGALDKLWARAKAYRRLRTVLRVDDGTLREFAPGHTTWALLLRTLGVLIVSPIALAAAAVHAVPHAATVAFAQRFAPESNRLMFARLGFGAVAFPFFYAAVASVLRWGAHWPAASVALAVVVGIVTGVATLAWGPWLLHQRLRLQLAWHARLHPADVSAARIARAALLTALADARTLPRAGTP